MHGRISCSEAVVIANAEKWILPAPYLVPIFNTQFEMAVWGVIDALSITALVFTASIGWLKWQGQWKQELADTNKLTTFDKNLPFCSIHNWLEGICPLFRIELTSAVLQQNAFLHFKVVKLCPIRCFVLLLLPGLCSCYLQLMEIQIFKHWRTIGSDCNRNYRTEADWLMQK